jgi:hypothetical protein
MSMRGVAALADFKLELELELELELDDSCAGAAAPFVAGPSSGILHRSRAASKRLSTSPAGLLFRSPESR